MIIKAIFKSIISIYKFVASTFARLPWKYAKLMGLRFLAEQSIRKNKLDKATAQVNELLNLAEQFKNDWSYGNSIHAGNLLLGIINLRQNNIDKAKKYLRLAGLTTGSPQLYTFGPNMSLAKELLEIGERDAVIEYFNLCRKFWHMDFGKLDYWTVQVRAGEVPDFGGNLTY
jgi:hypothetical protein